MAKTIPAFFEKNFSDISNPFYSHEIRWMNTARIKSLFSRHLNEQIGRYSCIEDLRQHLPEKFSQWKVLRRAQYLEISIFLSNYLLSSQGDRPAMGHSLEIRLPFLDYRVMEEACRIPERWKIFGLREKFLLKKVFAKILPKAIVSRTKHPYRAPIRKTLLQENPYHQELLSPDGLRQSGLFDPEKVSRLLSSIRSSQFSNETHDMALAGILTTQILHDQFLRNFHPSLPSVPANPAVFDYRTESCRKDFQKQTFFNSTQK